jgi:aryl-alcohol dehydrogenase-like predicted oxidoreductase
VTPLPVRNFGDQADTPTVIGLGGAVIKNKSYSEGVATVRRARELGITYFDTSPGYAGNLSQPIMGEGLTGAGDEVMVAAKIGYFKNPGDYRTPAAIRSQIEDNLRLLGRDYVDVLQIHEANWVAWWQDGVEKATDSFDIDGTYDFDNSPGLETLRQAKRDGLCRHIGITGNRAQHMCHVLRNVSVDTFLLAFSYDPIIRYAEIDGFDLAAERRVTLILGAIFHADDLRQFIPSGSTSRPPG